MAVTIAVGQQMPFQIGATNASGQPAPLNKLSFVSSVPAVATIVLYQNGKGALFAQAVGTTTITVTHTWTDNSTITGTVVVTVVAASKPTTLTVTTQPLTQSLNWQWV